VVLWPRAKFSSATDFCNSRYLSMPRASCRFALLMSFSDATVVSPSRIVRVPPTWSGERFLNCSASQSISARRRLYRRGWRGDSLSEGHLCRWKRRTAGQQTERAANIRLSVTGEASSTGSVDEPKIGGIGAVPTAAMHEGDAFLSAGSWRVTLSDQKSCAVSYFRAKRQTTSDVPHEPTP